MSTDEVRRRHAALQALLTRALADHRLRAELPQARREFFGLEREVPAVTDAQEQRFFEWLLLERESLQLAAVPLEVFGDGLMVDDDDVADLLEDSLVGAFAIETAQPTRVQARDLQTDELLEVVAPSGTLRTGDLVVGRLFPLGADTWQPSSAIALHRPGQTLAAAFRRDTSRLELERRLTQAELEQLLLHRPAPATPAAPAGRPIEHLEAELDAVLRRGGAEGLAADVSESLAHAARPGQIIGPLLDQLAFDTDVDLDQARRALVDLWNAHHRDELTATAAAGAEATDPAPAPARDERTAEGLGQRLVRLLDEGLSQKRDVAELFAELHAVAGIEPDPDDDDALAELGEDLQAAAGEVGDVGNLGPLVTEYLWETEQQGGVESTLQLWVSLQNNASLPHTNLEDITGQDLMRLLLHVYLRAEPTARAADVRAAFAVVQQFAEWAEETQELSLRPALDSCRGVLVDQVERLQQAGVRLSGSAAATGRPTLLRVEDVTADGFGVRSDEGSHWIPVDRDAAALLRPKDLLLGTLRPGGRGAALGGLVVVLPSDAEALIG